MKEIGGLDAVLAQPGFEEVTPDLVDTILDEAGKFAAEVLAPLNQPGDRQGNRWDAGAVHTADGFKEAYASFCERDLCKSLITFDLRNFVIGLVTVCCVNSCEGVTLS